MVVAWKAATDFEGTCGDLFSYDADAVVSPANSFGFMDGNADYFISQRLGWDVMQRLQAEIRGYYDGELLVGQAVAIATSDPVFRYVISAPTMTVPIIIEDYNAIYLAARAAVRKALALNLDSLIFTGMGTGCGQVPYKIAAHMMAEGIRDALNPPTFPASWGEAQQRHFNRLNCTGTNDGWKT